MNCTQINDLNYPTIESLANSKGCMNSALSKSDRLRELAAYKELLEKTRDLDAFDGIMPKHRLDYYLGRATAGKCVKCGKPFVAFGRSQERFALCRHRQIKDAGAYRDAMKASRDSRRTDFLRTLADRNPTLSEDEYRKTLAELGSKPGNYAFVVTKDEYRSFYHDLLTKTSGIVPIGEKDLEIPKRLYLEANDLAEEPKCRYCGNRARFVNRKTGYSDSCGRCGAEKSKATRESSNRASIDKALDFSKYEIVSYPKLLNVDPLTVRCLKCGKTTETFVNNGSLTTLRDAALCRHCERKAGWEETGLFEFVSSVYGGEIIHGEGARKIIPPMELDIYLPEKKLAFEYDGVFWHSDANGKGRGYHLSKTKTCEERGIRLVHVFSNEWNLKREIAKSRIRNMLGVYDRTVYARRCEVRETASGESRLFQDENHMQGHVNSSANLGLYLGAELVALMTFGKCRFDKSHEWEMLRFCSKLNTHVIGAAGKLLNHFEKNYRPKSLVTYADRRWSDGNLYRKLGFAFVRNSPPNYWYFKERSEVLLSRVQFQKHKLARLLDTFDPSKSEKDNMSVNGYYRIFDCGNMVFEKEYPENQA